MRRISRLFLRRVTLGALALAIFSVVILSTLRLAMPEIFGLWVVLVVGLGSAILFVIVMLLIEVFAKRKDL